MFFNHVCSFSRTPRTINCNCSTRACPLERLLIHTQHPHYIHLYTTVASTLASTPIPQARVEKRGSRTQCSTAGRGFLAAHSQRCPPSTGSAVVTTGARAKAWCLLIHADASLSLSAVVTPCPLHPLPHLHVPIESGECSTSPRATGTGAASPTSKQPGS